jgi:LysM repeat protein
MLIQGCKRENTEADNNPPLDTNTPAATDTNTSPMEASNTTAIVSPVPTNPPVVVPPPVESATTEYTVVAGDTLGKIAKKSGVTLKALEDANPGVVPTKLKINQKLVIPAPTNETVATTSAMASTDSGEEIYKVKSGDTLTKIAKQYGVTVKAIESENNLSTTKIKVGQKLKIPAKAEAAAPAPMPVVPAPVMPAPLPSTPPAH